MATFIDIHLADYMTSTSKPVRAESNIGTNPGYRPGKQVTGKGQSDIRTTLVTQKQRRVLQLLGRDCACH